jgi:D-ribose pyranose/furanose isomerase RbsD
MHSDHLIPFPCNVDLWDLTLILNLRSVAKLNAERLRIQMLYTAEEWKEHFSWSLDLLELSFRM